VAVSPKKNSHFFLTSDAGNRETWAQKEKVDERILLFKELANPFATVT
jgi:hypothetical protein